MLKSNVPHGENDHTLTRPHLHRLHTGLLGEDALNIVLQSLRHNIISFHLRDMELSWMADYTLPAVLSPEHARHSRLGPVRTTDPYSAAAFSLVTGRISIHSGWGWYSEEVSRGRVLPPELKTPVWAKMGKKYGHGCVPVTWDLDLWLAYGGPIKLSVPMSSSSGGFIYVTASLQRRRLPLKRIRGKCRVENPARLTPVV